jgi:5-methylcytosine-specific restriction enzyme subunit McrC
MKQPQRNRIQVFEHQPIYIDKTYSNVKFERRYYDALFKLNELHNDKYFRTLHNGICFKQYVGVIQVDGLTIEVLPKIDNTKDDTEMWQNALLEMLRVAKKIKVQKAGRAHVTKQNRHLLDIYFEWYLNEVRALIHSGLIKQYYKETGNVKALKGKLEFAGHISKNLVHKERFYTTHQVYGTDHLIHQILNKALEIVARFSKGTYIYSECKTVQASFPEVASLKVTKDTFIKLQENRKTAPYSTALEIAKFIILNYAPDVKGGDENMLALLFDMNVLWEQYILEQLRIISVNKNIIIHGQRSKAFWEGIHNKPDIVIELPITNKGEKNKYFVIDTKWKDISGSQPSTQDLRQMYVYNEYWTSGKAMLLYPSNFTKFDGFKTFNYLDGKVSQHHCGLGRISIFNENSSNLNNNIGEKILEWFAL